MPQMQVSEAVHTQGRERAGPAGSPRSVPALGGGGSAGPAAGITAYLKNGGTLEKVAAIANDADDAAL